MFLLDHSAVQASVLGTGGWCLDKVAEKYYFTSYQLPKARTKVPSLACHLELSMPDLASITERASCQTPLPILSRFLWVSRSDGYWWESENLTYFFPKKCISHKTQIPSEKCPPVCLVQRFKPLNTYLEKWAEGCKEPRNTTFLKIPQNSPVGTWLCRVHLCAYNTVSGHWWET